MLEPENALNLGGNASDDTGPEDVSGLSSISFRMAEMSGLSSDDPLSLDGR